jgi:HSP20 family protein
MAAMQNAMDRMFDETWRGVSQGIKSLVLDVHESDTAYTVIANLPGVNPDEIEVNLHDGVLSISAEVPATETAENAHVLLQERVAGKFTRRLNLPREVDIDNVEANYENGVLTLNIPKSPEAQPRQIKVKALHSKN